MMTRENACKRYNDVIGAVFIYSAAAASSSEFTTYYNNRSNKMDERISVGCGFAHRCHKYRYMSFAVQCSRG